MPRRKIHRAFLNWLETNRHRFAIDLQPKHRTDRYLEFSFAGINDVLSVGISPSSLNVTATYKDECWDFILSLDAVPEPVSGGYICSLCEPVNQPQIFRDRTALWIDHLFKPLLEWVNVELAKSNWLVLEGEESSATTASISVDHPSLNPSRYRSDWTVLPLRNVDRSSHAFLEQNS